MLYRIFKDRILLLDDDKLAIGEIDYPLLNEESGVVGITNVLVDESARGEGVSIRLMKKLMEHLRANGLRAVPQCDFAKNYSEDHPEDDDVLGEWAFSRNRRTDPGRSFLEEASDPESDREGEDTVSVEEGDFGRDGKKKISDGILWFLCRFLQIVCAVLQAVILVLFLIGSVLRINEFGSIFTMITDGNVSEQSFAAASLLLLLFLAAELVWMLTQKRIIRHHEIRGLDTGRGLTNFLILFAMIILSAVIPQQDLSENRVQTGLLYLFSVFRDSFTAYAALTAGGAMICLIRRMIRR